MNALSLIPNFLGCSHYWLHHTELGLQRPFPLLYTWFCCVRLQGHTTDATTALAMDCETSLGSLFSLLQVTQEIFFFLLHMPVICCYSCSDWYSAQLPGSVVKLLFFHNKTQERRIKKKKIKKEHTPGYPPENTLFSFLFMKVLFCSSTITIPCTVYHL